MLQLPSLRKVGTGTEAETMLELYLLVCSSLLVHSACFLIQQRTPAQGMLHPYQSETSHINYKTYVPTGQSHWGNSSNEIPSSRITPVYVNLPNHIRGNFEITMQKLEREIYIYVCVYNHISLCIFMIFSIKKKNKNTYN